MIHRSFLFAAIIGIIAACGPPPNGAVSPRDRNYINQLEVDSVQVPGMTAYDLIQKLRPQFLHSRGATSFRDLSSGDPDVYLDGVLYGRVESLKQIGADQVSSVEFLSSGDATTRFGTNHVSGAILIRTR